MKRVLLFSVVNLFVPMAYAADANTTAGFSSMLPMLVAFGAIFYFLIIRPQNKRQQEHQSLINKVAKGDEVLTNGGILGKVAKISDDFLVLSVAESVDITIKKSAIANILPKGTLKSI